MEIYNGLDREIPAGTRVWIVGPLEPPPLGQRLTIVSFDGKCAIASWRTPVELDTQLECELTACEDTELE